MTNPSTEATVARPPRGRDLADVLTLWYGTFRAASETEELPDGFSLGFPRSETQREQLQRFVEVFQQRLPVYTFELVDDAGTDTLAVRITGPAKAKDYLATTIATANSDETSIVLRRKASLAGRAVARAQLLMRRATNAIRVVPDFLVIGAAKGGTTTLYADLITHPSIASAARKEVYFFDHAYPRGMSYYRSFFPTRGEKRKIERAEQTEFRTGEATPCYLFHPHVPRRVRESLPDVKLLVALRNPVDRAYSDYCMKQRTGYETASFEDAIDQEPERVRGELEKMQADESYFSYARWHFSYLGRSRYAEQLENWFEVFPREQILVLSSEEIFASPAEAYGKVMDHLGLPAWAPTAHRHSNTMPYPEMAPATRQRLAEYFAPHNERLFELLGRRFDWGE